MVVPKNKIHTEGKKFLQTIGFKKKKINKIHAPKIFHPPPPPPLRFNLMLRPLVLNNQSLSRILNFKPLFVKCAPFTFVTFSFPFSFRGRKVYVANRIISQICYQYYCSHFVSLFFATSAVRISLPSFCVRNNLLIQVFKRSGPIHQFVAVFLQILIVFLSSLSSPWDVKRRDPRNEVLSTLPENK